MSALDQACRLTRRRLDLIPRAKCWLAVGPRRARPLGRLVPAAWEFNPERAPCECGRLVRVGPDASTFRPGVVARDKQVPRAGGLGAPGVVLARGLPLASCSVRSDQL